ncbi:branched-chain amino acid ABC transporter permease [Aquihabitans daechungensis]|uniref:branched-chain amino acid ABC transporter permease n=1 Tax=Aquihabitans daechungensis TaxID=1052257 RepID=UPI003BA2DE19
MRSRREGAHGDERARALLVFGLASAAIYAVAASGLVVTYQTSGIFNFAHGAVAMWAAFVYWQLSSPDAWGLPVWLALVLTLGVFAPAFGFVIDKVLMRRLHDASPITRIVVPIGLLVALIQLATVVWSPAESRNLPRFFEGDVVRILGVGVDYHQIVVFVVAILVAVFLRILLYRTRVGVAMRAVVDSRDLAGLNGVSPDRISSLSWAVGCTLAAVAGVLIAPILTLDQTTLTLLVINAYAAAVVGRLRSLPLTVVGAVILGLLREAASRYSTDINSWMAPGTEPGGFPSGLPVCSTRWPAGSTSRPSRSSCCSSPCWCSRRRRHRCSTASPTAAGSRTRPCGRCTWPQVP